MHAATATPTPKCVPLSLCVCLWAWLQRRARFAFRSLRDLSSLSVPFEKNFHVVVPIFFISFFLGNYSTTTSRRGRSRGTSGSRRQCEARGQRTSTYIFQHCTKIVGTINEMNQLRLNEKCFACAQLLLLYLLLYPLSMWWQGVLILYKSNELF